MNRFDVTAFGEVLIDFTCSGKNAEGKNVYEENPGGAPANCVGALCKLGGKGAFIGMTGKDSFGEDIRMTLKGIGVDITGMRYSPLQHTTLAFVSLDEKGERHFSFCRNPGADTQISKQELDYDILRNSRILQVGSLSLTEEPSKSATLEAIRYVKENGGLVSYDPNWRENLWKGRDDAFGLIKELFQYADIVKLSKEELYLLFGKGKEIDFQKGAGILFGYGVNLVLITLGSDGVFYSYNNKEDIVSGIIPCKEVQVVDTTGAGDSFTGGLLYRLTRRDNPLDFTRAELEQDLTFANAVASLCVTKRGGIPALPSLQEVNAFLT